MRADVAATAIIVFGVIVWTMLENSTTGTSFLAVLLLKVPF